MLLRVAAIAASLVLIAHSALAADSGAIEIPKAVQPAPAPSDQPRNETRQQQAAPDKQGTLHVPFIVKELPRERSEEEKTEAEQKTTLDRKATEYTGDLAFYTKYLFLATLLLATLTGGLALAAFLQMRDARKSIEASVTLANAAVAHAGHAERAIKVTEDAAKQQLRAYVSDTPTEIILSDLPDGAVNAAFRFVLENHGNTPGRNVRHLCIAHVCEYPGGPDIEWPPGIDDGIPRTTIFPGATFTSVSDGHILSGDDLVAIFDGTVFKLYLICITRYDDVFMEPHETGVCVFCGGENFRDICLNARKAGERGVPFEYVYHHNYDN